MARLEGFEPPTVGLEIRCSIQLSYRRARKANGAETIIVRMSLAVNTNHCPNGRAPLSAQDDRPGGRAFEAVETGAEGRIAFAQDLAGSRT